MCIRSGTGTVGKAGIVVVGKTGLTGLASGGEGEHVDDGGENDGGGGWGFIVARISGGSGVDVDKISGGRGVEVEKSGSILICFIGVMERCNGVGRGSGGIAG